MDAGRDHHRLRRAESEARARAAGATLLHKPLSPAMIEGSAREATEAPPVAAAPVETAKAQSRLRRAGASSRASPVLRRALHRAGLHDRPAVRRRRHARGWFGYKAAAEKYPAVRNAGLIAKHVGMLAAAPLIGLVSIVVLPFVGLAALAWLGARALVENRKTA